MADQQILLDASPGQTFNVTLNINNTTVTLGLNLRYNTMAGYWMMTIFDASGNMLLSNIPLLTGTYPAGNLLAPYAYLNIGSCYLVNVSGDVGDYAGPTNLGTDYQLIWSDNP